MKYSIIIPYHSNRSLLNTCIQAVIRTIPEDAEIIVVANNDNPEELDIRIPAQCKTLKVNKSLYYPRAVNLGAQEAQGEYIVLMDADICVRQGWLEAFAAAFEKYPNTGGCSAKMLDPFDGSVKEFGIGFTGYNFPHPFAGRSEEFDLVCCDREVQAFCSALSMYKRTAYLEAGGMDEQLVDGYSDIDLCLRLHEQGLRTYVIANAVAYHYGSSTLGSGMSAHLRADTKGRFMLRRGDLCRTDMDMYYRLAFSNAHLRFAPEYLLADFTTIADSQRHYNLFSQLGHFQWTGTYRLPAVRRDTAHISLYTLLDDNIRRRPQPVCYFVDDFCALRHNRIWHDLRDCGEDLIIDRNANVLSLQEVR